MNQDHPSWLDPIERLAERAPLDYQLRRLATVNMMGGDGGIREDGTQVQREIAVRRRCRVPGGPSGRPTVRWSK
jgi:hypothetical protein